MNIIMNDERITDFSQIEEFLKGSVHHKFTGRRAIDRYRWIEDTLVRFEYHRQKKRHKGLLRRYNQKITGYSRAQVTRLIEQYVRKGAIQRNGVNRHRFPRKYTEHDVTLLAQTDEWHDFLSGPATRKIFEREYHVFGRLEYKNLSGISIAHIYNLRRRKIYLERTRQFHKTRPTPVNIGERAKPHPNGHPGYIRIDTVHQGDLNKEKGVYHINAVDEATQWEIVVSVEKISEAHMIPALEFLLMAFPFQVLEFHSDNGSEFINQMVARLLQKLLIRFTKSRARHTNDNALVESKNGSVIRKHLGYAHIPQKYADILNQYHQKFLNTYINFHRPCFFPETTIDAKGKIRKRYRYQDMMTPYEKFKSIQDVEQYLRSGVSFVVLDAAALAESDNQFAERMVRARSNLFTKIK